MSIETRELAGLTQMVDALPVNTKLKGVKREGLGTMS
jgi:hypothetical protein